jgi:hypothetical protein
MLYVMCWRATLLCLTRPFQVDQVLAQVISGAFRTMAAIGGKWLTHHLSLLLTGCSRDPRCHQCQFPRIPHRCSDSRLLLLPDYDVTVSYVSLSYSQCLIR